MTRLLTAAAAAALLAAPAWAQDVSGGGAVQDQRTGIEDQQMRSAPLGQPGQSWGEPGRRAETGEAEEQDTIEQQAQIPGAEEEQLGPREEELLGEDQVGEGSEFERQSPDLPAPDIETEDQVR